MRIVFLVIAGSWVLGGGYDFFRPRRHPVPRGEEGAGLVVAFLGIALVSAIFG